VRIDETGHNGFAAQIDLLHPGSEADGSGVADCRDFAVLNY
jgi:hypothetical protein